MVQIAAWIDEVIKNFGNAEIEARIAAEVKDVDRHVPGLPIKINRTGDR